MLKVGLTGGIGCGKSTVLALFRQRGIPCFEADRVARDYYALPDFVAQVRSVFGPSVINEEGAVNKVALADVVFADKSMLLKLNNLVHGRVMDDFESWCARQQAPYVLFESAILYDYGFDRLMDKMVAVYVDNEERIARVMARDNLSRHQVEARIANQFPILYPLLKADFVILNYEGNPRQRQVDYVHEALLAIV